MSDFLDRVRQWHADDAARRRIELRQEAAADAYRPASEPLTAPESPSEAPDV